MFGILANKRWPIALDLGAQSLKMLQMQRGPSGLSVRASGRYRFPASAAPDSEDWRRLAVRAVREILAGNGFRGTAVVSAIPSRQLKIRNVRLPGLSPDEMRQAVQWEAKERFGCDFTPDRLFHLRAGKVRQGAENCEEVILLGATAEVVEGHLALLKAMGLTPERIEAEPLAVFRPFERVLRRRSDSDAVSVIVDTGHTATNVVVARGQHVLLIKSLEVGGRDLTQAVAKQLNVSGEEAEELRVQTFRPPRVEAGGEAGDQTGDDEAEKPDAAAASDGVNWTVLDAVRGVVEAMTREIALCLRYCSVTLRGLRPQRVTVVGGGAYDAALVRRLGEQLGVPCEVGQPLRGLDTSLVDLGSDRRGVLAEWAVCAGLALHDAPAASNRKAADGQRRLSA